MSRPQEPSGALLARSFGPLEVQVLEAIWQRGRPATVTELRTSFPQLAYTTLMTTLDRLHRKGVLHRAKLGRAFAYECRSPRHEMELQLAARGIEGILGHGGRRAIAPLLSCFVDAVSERDRHLLDDLEAVLRAKRAALREVKKT